MPFYVILKVGILYPPPPAAEWLQYETISSCSLTAICLNWTNGLLRLINSMVTELECNEGSDETDGYSAL